MRYVTKIRGACQRPLYLLFIFGFATLSHARTTPPDTDVNHALLVLETYQVIRNRFSGMRPLSLSQSRKLLKEAELHLKKSKQAYPDPVWAAMRTLRRIFPRSYQWNFQQGFAASQQVSNEQMRSFPQANGIGFLDAAYLASGNRSADDEFRLRVDPSLHHRGFSFQTETEVPWRWTGTDTQPRLRSASLAWHGDTFDVTVGRQPIRWGFGARGGLLLADNETRLDGVKTGFHLPEGPGWLGYLGPSRWEFMLAVMEANRAVPNPLFFGGKASFRPTANLEIGFSHTYMMGGQGNPIRAYDPILEALFIRVQEYERNVANHLIGLEARYVFPRFGVLSTEFAWEDFGRPRIWAHIGRVMALRLAIESTAIRGSDSLRLEFTHIDPLVYRHGRFESGYTRNRRMLGHRNGPDSDGLLLRYTLRPHHQHRVETEAEWLVSRSNTYTTENYRLRTTESLPTEGRLRLGTRWEMTWNQSVSTRINAFIERIQNFEYVEGNPATILYVSVGASVSL